MRQTPRPLIRDSVPLNYYEFPIDESQYYKITPCYKYFTPKEIKSVGAEDAIEITSRFNCNYLFAIEYNPSGEISFVPGKNTICKPHLRENSSYIVECPNNRPSTLIIKNEDLDDLRNSYKRK